MKSYDESVAQADIVLVPQWEGLGEAAQRINEFRHEFTKEAVARLLPLEFSR